jgi:hypothetical protein
MRLFSTSRSSVCLRTRTTYRSWEPVDAFYNCFVSQKTQVGHPKGIGVLFFSQQVCRRVARDEKAGGPKKVTAEKVAGKISC